MHLVGSNEQKPSRLRSLVKGLSWRVLGTLDTMVIAYFVTSGNHTTAMWIGLLEVTTKLAWYYLHERVWVYFLQNTEATRWHSVLKTVSWRIVGTLDTFAISFLLTGTFEQAASIAGIEVFTKMILYYVHERAWNRVPVGTIRKLFGVKRAKS